MQEQIIYKQSNKPWNNLKVVAYAPIKAQYPENAAYQFTLSGLTFTESKFQQQLYLLRLVVIRLFDFLLNDSRDKLTS